MRDKLLEILRECLIKLIQERIKGIFKQSEEESARAIDIFLLKNPNLEEIEKCRDLIKDFMSKLEEEELIEFLLDNNRGIRKLAQERMKELNNV